MYQEVADCLLKIFELGCVQRITQQVCAKRSAAHPERTINSANRQDRSLHRGYCNGSRPRRLTALLAGGVLATLFAAAGAEEFAQPFEFAPLQAQNRTGRVTVLGALKLSNHTPDGAALHELSDLAWDADERLLYAVSDAGFLVALSPQIEGQHLSGVAVRWRAPLRDATGQALSGDDADAEGMVLFNGENQRAGDSLLAVSFEHHPRVFYFTPHGAYRGAVRLPPRLRDLSHYQTPNQALEALAWSPTLGFVTGPERPLRGIAADVIQLFAEDGREWQFPAAAPSSALVGLAARSPSEFIVLERRYISRWQPLVISLRKVSLMPPAKREEIARFDSSQGWAVDNFEGIAHHIENRYFIVSDDNANPQQKTLLVYLALSL